MPNAIVLILKLYFRKYTNIIIPANILYMEKILIPFFFKKETNPSTTRSATKKETAKPAAKESHCRELIFETPCFNNE